jgi:polyhydroxyalkanoate synthesis regulator phasin
MDAPRADASRIATGGTMKLSRTTVVVPLAGLLLVGAAGAVAATSGDPAPTTPVVAAAPSATPSPSAATTVKPEKTDTVLADVLDTLVSKGTITAAQETAIVDAITAERTARREARQAARQQLRDFLADGVITQDEFNSLPADSPLRTATTLMDDGKITSDELRSIGRGLLGGGRGGHGLGLGKGGDDATAAPSASPTTGG